MSPADEELIKMLFGEQIKYETEQYKKMFEKHIISGYTDVEIREFTKRESEYRIKNMHTVKGDVIQIKY